jgi:radical SAM superfamily enzyme YgiQ (UPF0313 family)
MTPSDRLCVKIIHCGNVSIANPRDREQKNIFFMPMGLFPLADQLRKNGFDAEIIHLDLEAGKNLEDILDFPTLDAVGFDCHWTNQALAVMETANLVKQIKPEIFIFLGGFTASLFAGEIISHYPQIDAIIRGDGEIPIVQLCGALHQAKKYHSPPALETVQNLVWRKNHENNQDMQVNIHMNDFSYVGTARDMAQLDLAAVDLLRNWQYYRDSSLFFSNFQPFKSTPVFFLETGRGCQYACVYCGGNCSAQKKMNNRHHTVFRPIDSVVETIKKAASLGFKTVYSCMERDDSDDYYIQLFNQLEEERIKINYCYGSWRLPSRPLIDALSQSFKHTLIEISPETSNIRLRKKNKDPRLFYTNEQLEETLQYISDKKNINVQLYFGYYLDADTVETITHTLRFALSMLLKYYWFVEMEYSNFSTDPGSLFFSYPEKYNIDMNVRNFNDYLKYLEQTYHEKRGKMADMTLFRPKTVTLEENDVIHKKITLFYYLFSSYKKSLANILSKTGNPDIVMEFLQQPHRLLNENNSFSQHKVRDLLIENCNKHNILDVRLYKSICSECDKQDANPTKIKGTYILSLDIEKEHNAAAEMNTNTNTNKNVPLTYARAHMPKEQDIEFDL